GETQQERETYSARHLFCASQGCPSLGSAPCFSSMSAPSLLKRTPPRRSPCPLAASHGVTPALLTALTLTPRSIICSGRVFHPRYAGPKSAFSPKVVSPLGSTPRSSKNFTHASASASVVSVSPIE